MPVFLSHFGLAQLLGLSSSILFSITLVLLRQGMRFSTPLTAVLTINSVVSLGGFTASYFYEDWNNIIPMAIFWFGSMGIIGAGVGAICRMVAVVRMDLSSSTLVASTTPIWGVLFAMFFLGENPTFKVLIGTVLIVVGVCALTIGRDNVETDFKHWFQTALIFPVVSSFVYAIAPIFTKYGYFYQKTPYLALGVAFGLGNVLLLLARPILPKGNAIFAPTKSLICFLIGGIFNLMAAFCFMNALTFGDVTLILPVSRLTPLWVVLFSSIFFRKIEKINSLVIFAAIMVVSGGLLISLK
ncbi:MAG: DMT family transporter [Nitrospinota bacterium]|nr:DMT family transporter [Nitrospinota bacterium]